MEPTERIALVHDHLMQRGGAERVALVLARAFPKAPLFTSFYDPASTYPGFEQVDVRPMRALNAVPALRRNFRAAMPLLPAAFSALRPKADVTICSSSGWSHGVRPTGRKIVYYHAAARWLYQSERYLGQIAPRDRDRAALSRSPLDRLTAVKAAGRSILARTALRSLEAPLRSWDRRAALAADRYLANSSATAASLADIYGIDAEVLHPPPGLSPEGASRQVEGIESGFWLCVSRLLPYKNIDVVLRAAALHGDRPVVVAGIGPDTARLSQLARAEDRLLGRVEDSQLRWLYENCCALVSASYEDFGLTPLEAASFGKPSAVLRFGGFLDTVIDGKTGVLFDQVLPEAVEEAMGSVLRLASSVGIEEALRRHAGAFSEGSFCQRMVEVATEERAR